MSLTSKSPRKVALEALAVARQALPTYSSEFSRKDFTLAQHFACLVLKCFLRTDYRGIVAFLADLPDLMKALELKKVPHFTTLQKAHVRILSFGPSSQLLDVTVRRALHERLAVELAAGDSTGIDSSQISPYFIKRRSPKHKTPQTTTYSRYPKLELLCDCRTHIVLHAIPTLGPHPDTDRLRPLLFPPLSRGVKIDCALFDAGYDSESNHVFCRESCGIRSVIPPLIGRRFIDPTREPRGRWRRLMKRRRDWRFGQRWQVETVISMIKRRLGGYVLNRSNPARSREMMLKVLTHNIMILLCWMWRVSTEQD
ncbi:MAG: transposase, partial [Tepidisphaeraceae bacterium]